MAGVSEEEYKLTVDITGARHPHEVWVMRHHLLPAFDYSLAQPYPVGNTGAFLWRDPHDYREELRTQRMGVAMADDYGDFTACRIQGGIGPFTDAGYAFRFRHNLDTGLCTVCIKSKPTELDSDGFSRRLELQIDILNGNYSGHETNFPFPLAQLVAELEQSHDGLAFLQHFAEVMQPHLGDNFPDTLYAERLYTVDQARRFRYLVDSQGRLVAEVSLDNRFHIIYPETQHEKILQAVGMEFELKSDLPEHAALLRQVVQYFKSLHKTIFPEVFNPADFPHHQETLHALGLDKPFNPSKGQVCELFMHDIVLPGMQPTSREALLDFERAGARAAAR